MKGSDSEGEAPRARTRQSGKCVFSAQHYNCSSTSQFKWHCCAGGHLSSCVTLRCSHAYPLRVLSWLVSARLKCYTHSFRWRRATTWQRRCPAFVVTAAGQFTRSAVHTSTEHDEELQRDCGRRMAPAAATASAASLGLDLSCAAWAADKGGNLGAVLTFRESSCSSCNKQTVALRRCMHAMLILCHALPVPLARRHCSADRCS